MAFEYTVMYTINVRQHGVRLSLLLVRPDSPVVGHQSTLHQSAPQGLTQVPPQDFWLVMLYLMNQLIFFDDSPDLNTSKSFFPAEEGEQRFKFHQVIRFLAFC